MPEPVSIRRLAVLDLVAFKALRDSMLAAHPEAFTSDAAAEGERAPASYLDRFGADRADGGHFTLGAWRGERLVGALGCERDRRVKVRHIGHLIGMMVSADARGSGIGRSLLEVCIRTARDVPGFEMLTLTVTAGNDAAIHLYQSAGFTRYGSLPRAICVDGRYSAKEHMVLTL